MVKPPKEMPPLGDLEHEIANLIWTQGPMTAAAVRKLLPRPLKDPTIRTVLRRLEEKGYFKHKLENGAFMYYATESREEVAAKAVQGIVDRFGGSLEDVLAGMVKAALIEPAQLQTIAGRLKKFVKPR
jgi:BlaI family penicillinase repressor